MHSPRTPILLAASLLLFLAASVARAQSDQGNPSLLAAAADSAGTDSTTAAAEARAHFFVPSYSTKYDLTQSDANWHQSLDIAVTSGRFTLTQATIGDLNRGIAQTSTQ